MIADAGARAPVVVVAWDGFQARTKYLSGALGGPAYFFRGRPSQKALLPVRYLFEGIRMWRMLERHRPRALVVITPPVLAPLVGWWWSITHGCRLVVDCHTGTFHSRRWRWSRSRR